MLVYHLVDPYLTTETFFRKDKAAENGGIDSEIGDIGTSARWYWRLKKFHAEPIYFFITFLVTKI